MISANGVEYKNVPEQVQYLTEQIADIWTAIEGINPPDLTLYALKTYVDAADSALGTRITAVENSIGTLLTKTEAANTYAKIADIGTYINLSDYVKTVDMYTYVQAEIQNFDLDSNNDFTALKSRVSTLESSVSSMTSDIADANTTAANAQTAAGNAVNTANNASAVATNAYNTATSAASDVADMQTTINSYDSRIDAVESTVAGFQASLTTAQNTANAALAKADSALSMIAGLHSLTKEEKEFEGDNVAITGFVEGSLCTLTKLEGDTRKSINIWDEQTEQGSIDSTGNNVDSTTSFRSKNFISIKPNENYMLHYGSYSSNSVIYYYFYDSNKNFISSNLTLSENQSFTSPALAYYMKIRSGGSNPQNTYNNDICINESDADINGTYYPYFDGLKSVSISGLSTGGGVVITTSEGTTSLVPTLDDDTLELRMLDYLEQTISGTSIITSHVIGSGIIDLGSLAWTQRQDITSRFESSDVPGIKLSVYPNRTLNFIISSNKYHKTQIDIANDNLSIFINGKAVVIYDNSIATASELKNSLNGVYLVYELATPVTTVLATVTYTDVSAFFETGATITVNNANTGYLIESTSTMYGYVAE